jgi:hypothetical protein
MIDVENVVVGRTIAEESKQYNNRLLLLTFGRFFVCDEFCTKEPPVISHGFFQHAFHTSKIGILGMEGRSC